MKATLMKDSGDDFWGSWLTRIRSFRWRRLSISVGNQPRADRKVAPEDAGDLLARRDLDLVEAKLNPFAGISLMGMKLKAVEPLLEPKAILRIHAPVIRNHVLAARSSPSAGVGADSLEMSSGWCGSTSSQGHLTSRPAQGKPGSIGHRDHRTGSWKKVKLMGLPGKLKGPLQRPGGVPPRRVMSLSAIARGEPGRARTGTPVWRPRVAAREAGRGNGDRSPPVSGLGASAGGRGVAARPARAIVPTRRSDPAAGRNRRRPRPGFPASSADDDPEWRRTR